MQNATTTAKFSLTKTTVARFAKTADQRTGQAPSVSTVLTVSSVLIG